MRKTAIVTGATSGIGEATAMILARNGFNLIITGRRSDKLKAVEEALLKIDDTKVLSLVFDVRINEEVQKALCNLPAEWSNIDVLVNNAGLAVGTEPAHEAVVDDWERMIDTNVKGLLYVTRCLTPGMVERKKGHIINISSIAGKESYPGGSVYCGTKHAVAAISKAMRIELVQYGVKVSTIAPGMVDTEFSIVRFKGDQSKAENVYKGLTPLYAQDIAETILFMVTRPAHVNLDDVLIMPTDQASARDARRDQ